MKKTQDQKDAERWRYWRDQGVVISDAPVQYTIGDEADKYTDEAIKALEKHRRKNKRLVAEGRKV